MHPAQHAGVIAVCDLDVGPVLVLMLEIDQGAATQLSRRVDPFEAETGTAAQVEAGGVHRMSQGPVDAAKVLHQFAEGRHRKGRPGVGFPAAGIDLLMSNEGLNRVLVHQQLTNGAGTANLGISEARPGIYVRTYP